MNGDIGDGVEFRILGPLEVVDGGSSVAVGGPKPRALLAALLLAAGAVVSTDRLVTAVWGAAPPRDAVGALRAYVSRLRAVLPEGDRRLRWRAPGYTFDVADGELDAAVFTRMLGQARERAAVGDHRQAADLLDAALALWRGEALDEFDAADIDADRHLALLADLRLVAAQERAEAVLRVGRGPEVVAELEALVARHPDREAPAALLMRALYASGRQADALAVYRALRRHLVEELGVEPSDATREVHRRVLEQDPALAPAEGARPSNLPRRGTVLVGRDTAIIEVAAALRASPLVTLVGVGGVGKSRLAVEVASRERFADGAWLCELAPLADGGSVAHAVAAVLRLQQRHGATIEQTVVGYLAGRSLLLMLDNCEHVLDAAARLAAGVVAQCPDVVVLATSREPLGVAGEQVWPVPTLPLPDAAALFVQRARATRPDFDPVRERAGSVAEICRRVDGLPLGIELAAARTRAMSAAEIAERLDDGRLLANGPRTAQPRHQSLAAAIDWSYQLLSGREQRLFARMSVFAGGADLAAVHAVCGEPGTAEAESLDLLTALVDKSMVTVVGAAGQDGATRYRMLETLRAYGREHLAPEEEVGRRHATFFVGVVEAAASGVQGADERAWVEATLPDADNLRAAFEFLIAERDADLALRLVAPLAEVLDVRRGFESAEWAERALELADRAHPFFAAAVGAAARGAWCVGDFAKAGRLAAMVEGKLLGPGTARSGHPTDVAADIALYRGDVATAERHYASEVDRARRDGDQIRLVWTLYYVAICHAVRRMPERGVAAARESLDVATATGNPTALSMGRYALGLVLKKSDPDQALALLDEAARLAASVRNFWWEGIALMEAAATRAVHRDVDEAAAALIGVLDHWDRVGDWNQQWLNLRYVVRLLLRVGDEEAAAVLHHCLLAAGRPSSLGVERAARLLDGPGGPRLAAAAGKGAALSAAEAVTLARERLSSVD